MRVALAGAFVFVLTSAVHAQTGRAVGDVQRTPWGDPDLQGVWDYWTFTPLERPKEYAGKAMLTDAEHAALVARLSGEAAALDARQRSARDTGAYSQEAWTDRARGTALKQTSLITDPPDGKLPPLTPEAQQKEAAHKAAGGYPVRMRTGGIELTASERLEAIAHLAAIEARGIAGHRNDVCLRIRREARRQQSRGRIGIVDGRRGGVGRSRRF